MARRARAVVTAAAALFLVGATAVVAGNAWGASAPKYTANVTNPWFPLKPGTTLVYEGVKDGRKAVDEFHITNQVVKVDGVPTRLVLDRLFLDGKLAETTADYYTQDAQGNVHYYGEDTATIDDAGNMEPFGTDGTWHAAEFGAEPGVFMPAVPKVGDTYRQEYLKGHAEDQFEILDLSASVTVPYGTFHDALKTKEWTALEPGVVDNKYYVRGIGMVDEATVKGGDEHLSLKEIRSS
jgi:hypothetical protein